MSGQPQRTCNKCGLGPPYVEFRQPNHQRCILCKRARERKYNQSRAGKRRAKRYLESGRWEQRKQVYRDSLLGKIARCITVERWRVNHATSEKRRQSAQLRLEMYLEQRERIWRERREAKEQRRAS